MKQYCYKGPVTALQIGKESVTLVSGACYPLPEDHPKVKKLVGLGHLTEQVEKPRPAAKPEPASAKEAPVAEAPAAKPEQAGKKKNDPKNGNK
ncbi:MAG TPA: hypothetical protein PLV42_06900 [bacterium]|nr:hypothetical protein [bacterium]